MKTTLFSLTLIFLIGCTSSEETNTITEEPNSLLNFESVESKIPKDKSKYGLEAPHEIYEFIISNLDENKIEKLCKDSLISYNIAISYRDSIITEYSERILYFNKHDKLIEYNKEHEHVQRMFPEQRNCF